MSRARPVTPTSCAHQAAWQGTAPNNTDAGLLSMQVATYLQREGPDVSVRADLRRGFAVDGVTAVAGVSFVV